MRWGETDDRYLLLESQKEFKKDSRRVAIKGFPDGTPKGQIEELLRAYDIETIHMDKNGTSCKVVFGDEQEAKLCIAEIEMHGLRRGWRLEGKNTASDFMICVSHFPLEWDEDNFKELIKDYGETEKCFLVRSKFLDNKSMGYGFLEFTSKSSAIIARNELHGKPVKYENRTYRIQVHWIDRIPEEYDELQSCTVYCQLPDEWQITQSLSEQLREFMSVFDLVFFDIAQLTNENGYYASTPPKTIIAIAEYDTPEQAAMTVKQLRTTLFPRFGEPLQIMFSLPQYGAHVLLKSFEIFHNEFLMEKRKNRLKDSLWTAPENDMQRYRPSSPKPFQLQAELARQSLLQQQQIQQQLQLRSTQQALEAQLVARVQAAQKNANAQLEASRQLQHFSSQQQPGQQSSYQIQQQRHQQQQQLLQQQLLAQQQQNSEYEKLKRFSTGLDQVRFGSSGMVAPDQRFQQQHQQQQQHVQAKPKLDLLSEQFSEQKLSQKLFNSSTFSPSPDHTLQREQQQQLHLQRQMNEQKHMREVSYELELKKLDFDRKQMMRRRGMSSSDSSSNYRYGQHQSTIQQQQQHSLESMTSSSDHFITTDPFQQTPPRVLRSSEPDTKDSPKSLHLLGSLLVNSLVDSNSPQRTPWSTQDNETPSKDLVKSISALGRDWTPDKFYNETARKRRYMTDYNEYDKRYQYSHNQVNQNHIIANKLG